MTNKVLVASTVAAHCCDGLTELRWLTHGEKWLDRGYEFFTAIQYAQGHDDALDPLAVRIAELEHWADAGRRKLEFWGFAVNQGEASVSSDNRIAAICAGRNLAHEYAQRRDFTHIQFIDTDVMPTEDGIEKLLELDTPVRAAHVPAYCHVGPRLYAVGSADYGFEVHWDSEDIPHPATGELLHFDGGEVEEWAGNGDRYLRPREWDHRPFPEGADVRIHPTTAGALLLDRDVFRAIRWRGDNDAGLSDDPAFQADAERLGFGRTWVRHDVVWDHEPLAPLEVRGRDLSVRGS